MDTIDNIELPVYPIRTAAKLLGISVHTLRMYEKEGLILPFKKETSHRLYSKSDIDRLTCIRRAINESKISIAGIKTMYALIPCWDITQCSTEDQKNCDAYTNHSEPCWTFDHHKNICGEMICRNCRVYKSYSECGKIKESIKQLQKST